MLSKRFFKKHCLFPLGVLLTVLFLFEYYQWDLAIAQWLYAQQGGTWILRHNWWTDGVIHGWGRRLVILLSLIALIGLGRALWQKNNRRAWILLTLSVATSMLIVSTLKRFTHVDCPYNVTLFGGQDFYVPIFSLLPDGMKVIGRCFPGGHASGGYAWVALYYFFTVLTVQLQRVRCRWRYFGLAFGLLLGAIFDIGQQLRGAHFLSHGLWTLTISWGVCSFYFWLFYRDRLGATANKPSIISKIVC